MNKSNTILVLPSWYPSRVDKFNGDFIQRHVHAIALFKKQFLIYVIKDLNAKDRVEVTINKTTNLTEKIIYYRPVETGINFIDRVLSYRAYLKLMKQAVDEFITTEAEPELVHVHVGMKAGIIARWLKIERNIPYIVSEHWTGYLTEAKENIYDTKPWYRKTLVDILKNASVVTAVSHYLGEAIQKLQPVVRPVCIANVVDTTIFYPNMIKEKKPVFIHASVMNYQKNTEAIIEAMTDVIKSYPEAKLHLYGPMPAHIQQHIIKLDLVKTVLYKGEVSQQELAKAMQTATALVLYSRYETFGCVIIEANACHLPVIVSDIPVFHELVKENKNGIFVPLDNEKALSDAFISTWQLRIDEGNFNIDEYSYETVGKKFVALYENILKSN
jgi:glycosyltransferase involved in cell wall biosynthesis